jgi:flagellar biosynthesis/type III secretory pathway protein FliH
MIEAGRRPEALEGRQANAMLRSKRKSVVKKTSSFTSSAKWTDAGVKGELRKKTLQRRKGVQRKRLASSDKEYAHDKLLYNEGYNTGFAKGFEDGHREAYELKL